jgi:hypothetical protein
MAFVGGVDLRVEDLEKVPVALPVTDEEVLPGTRKAFQEEGGQLVDFLVDPFLFTFGETLLYRRRCRSPQRP